MPFWKGVYRVMILIRSKITKPGLQAEKNNNNRAHHEYKKNTAMTDCLSILFQLEGSPSSPYSFSIPGDFGFFSACSSGLVYLRPKGVPTSAAHSGGGYKKLTWEEEEEGLGGGGVVVVEVRGWKVPYNLDMLISTMILWYEGSRGEKSNEERI